MSPFDDKKTLYIIDGYGFIFRAFYAVPNLTTANNEPIGAVFGFFKMLISLINSAKPDYMVVALDTGRRTFRNDIYDEFVENRAIDELFSSADYRSMFEAAGLTLEEVKSKKSEELEEVLKVDKLKLKKLCESCGLSAEHPPKLMVLLVFLQQDGNIVVEDYKTRYKANRAPTPDALKGQFGIIRELIDAMNIAHESVIGFEADDVIGSLARKATTKGFRVVVVSADKDLCQLVEDGKISVYDPAKKRHLDEAGVLERFGVKASQVCDYLSIVGDHCDNVFGVNGVGPKGAIKLLEQYGSIENILTHIDDLEGRIKDKFCASADVLKLAHRLISLRYDAIVVEDFEKYKLSVDHGGLAKFIEKYGFKSLDKTQRSSGFAKHNKSVASRDSQQSLKGAGTINRNHHGVVDNSEHPAGVLCRYTKQGSLF